MTYFKPNKWFVVFVLVLFLLVLALPVSAQESPEVVPFGTPTNVIDAFLLGLLGYIVNAVGGASLGPIVTGLVQISKRVFKDISVNNLVIFWWIFVGLVALVADYHGFTSQFLSAGNSLVSLASVVLGFSLMPVTARGTYRVLKAQAVPVLGYSRSAASEPLAA